MLAHVSTQSLSVLTLLVLIINDCDCTAVQSVSMVKTKTRELPLFSSYSLKCNFVAFKQSSIAPLHE